MTHQSSVGKEKDSSRGPSGDGKAPAVGRVGLSGASGFIGRRLVPFLREAGLDVLTLTRGRSPATAGEAAWDPAAGTIDRRRLEGLKAFVHLAGENIGSGRWSARKKRAIRESRVLGTRLVSECLAGLERPPAVLVSASAVGFYGDAGSRLLDEESPVGEGFLASVCREWEEATEPARRAGIRVVRLRTGVVLSPSGGVLQRMARVYRLGLGGRVGSGRQFMSWIAMEDLLGVVLFAMERETLSGPVNAVAPEPVSNAHFSKALGRALHRPARVPVPGFAVALLFGEMGKSLLLSSARVQPGVLLREGFAFTAATLEAALRLAYSPS